MPGARAVLANAMWRTGSTYLGSRFARSPAYMLFYEPDHENVGRVKPIMNPAKRNRPKFATLNHPDLGRSYFDAYHSFDPLTARPLPAFQPTSAALRDVYNQASPRMIGFLQACERVARAEGRVPVFGFCRSGTQHVGFDAALDGDAIHLWRDPREQFASYDWPRNDYFIPGTLAQLLLSRHLRAPTLDLLGSARLAWGARAMPLAERLGVRNALRLSRLLCRELSHDQTYMIFYVSWLRSMSSGRATASMSFSINQLIEDAALRDELAHRFGIDLEAARSTARPVPADPGYAAIERRVEQALARWTGAERAGSAPGPAAASALSAARE